MASPHVDVDALLQAYARAVATKDVEAYLALYDDEVYVYDLWNAWSYPDKAAWADVVRDWLDPDGGEDIVVEFDDVTHVGGGGLDLVRALMTTKTGRDEDGPERSMQSRLTWVLASRGGRWHIIHEHTSAPADDVTGRVMLHC